MKISDLVEFYSSSWVFDVSRDYASPGIILKKGQREKTYCVLWSDQRLTTENECYLRILKDNNEDR